MNRNICPIVRAIKTRIEDLQLSATPILNRMRMIKSAEELQLARHAGQVATAMMLAGRNTIKADVAEFEVLLQRRRLARAKLRVWCTL